MKEGFFVKNFQDLLEVALKIIGSLPRINPVRV
jgi:hypothetical protein